MNTELNIAQPVQQPTDSLYSSAVSSQIPQVTPVTSQQPDSLPESQPVTDRQIAATAAPVDTAVSASDLQQTLRAICSHGTDHELATLMHAHGVFGLLLTRNPEEGTKIALQRLEALKATVSSATWYLWSKGKAQAKLEQIASLLNESKFDEFLAALTEFEKGYQFGSFDTVMNEVIKGNELVLATNPLMPVSTAKLSETCRSGDQSISGQNSEAAFTQLTCGGKLPEINSWNSDHYVYQQLLNSRPDVVKELLIDQLAAEVRLAKMNGNTASFLKASDSLRSACDLNPSDVAGFINSLRRKDLKTQLAKEATALCIEADYLQITKAEFSTLSKAELAELHRKTRAILKLDQPLINTADQGEDFVEDLKVYDKALRITRLMMAECDKALEDRVYMLPVPDTARLIRMLSAPGTTAEDKLYKAADIYLQHVAAYQIRRNNNTLRAMQQARHDFRLAQENALIAETKAHLASNNAETVLSTGRYEDSRELLIKMDSALQRTAPVRPVAETSSACLHLGAHVIWGNRATIQQRLADLQHQKDLIDCQYDFNEALIEFGLNRCMDTVNVSGVLTSGIKTLCSAPGAIAGMLASPIGTCLNVIKGNLSPWKAMGACKTTVFNSIRDGRITIWSLMLSSSESATQFEQKARATLESTLAIAQRNPRLFRRVMGDSAHNIQWLLSVAGIGNAGLISSLQTRLQVEATASVFAGDTAVFEDLKEEDMETMRQFQLLCDLSSMAFKLTTACTGISAFTSNSALSRAGEGLGAIAGGIGGGVAGIAAGPAGVAVGIAAGASTGKMVGGYAGATANAALQVGGAVAIREAVNNLDGKALRAANKVINYGITAPLTGQSRWDTLAMFGRNVAQKQSWFQATVNAVFTPQMFRLNKLAASVTAVIHGEPGAVKGLLKETAICSGIVVATAASTALLSTAVFYTGFVTIAMSPFLTASLGTLATIIISSNTFSWLVNNTEAFIEGVFGCMEELNQLLIPEGSDIEKQVNKQCQEEADRAAKALASQGLFRTYLAEEIAMEVAKNHWLKWSESVDQDLVDEVNLEFDERMAQCEKERLRLAQELAEVVKAKNLIESYRKLAEDEQKAGALDSLKSELKKSGFECPSSPGQIEYYLQDQLRELEYTLIRQAGTAELDADLESIYSHLSERQRNAYMGNYLISQTEMDQDTLAIAGIDMLSLRLPQQQELDRITRETEERIYKAFSVSTAEAMKERLSLMLKGVAISVREGRKATGRRTKPTQEELAAAFNQEKLNVKDTVVTRKEAIHRSLEKEGLSSEERQRMLGIIDQAGSATAAAAAA